MIHQVFTVFDSKTEAYLPPFYEQTKGSAIRSFSEAANTAGHQFQKYSEDFTLFHLGQYDDTSARFEMFKTPVSVGVAIEFTNKN